MKKRLYIGTAGWNYKDWEGIVYPTGTEKKIDPLSYLSQYFNTIEINSSFYRPPSARSTSIWVDRIRGNPDFFFTYKLWQRFTHNRETMPGDQDEKLVKQGLDVLQKNERLGATLIQFPWSFKNTDENQDWAKKLIEKFKDYSPVIEVRHSSWNEKSFVAYLNDAGAAFANIDQPTIGQSIGLTNFAFTKLSYLRLHGRNYKNWFAKDADVASRYDYLYSESELNSIQATIEHLVENSPKTFIIFNNHFRGQAAANALQVMFLMGGAKFKVPQQLIKEYPQLKIFSLTDDKKLGQASLFEN